MQNIKIKLKCTISWKITKGHGKGTHETCDINLDELEESDKSVSDELKAANKIFKELIIDTIGKDQFEERQTSLSEH